LNTKYYVGNLDSGFGQTQKYGRVKPVHEIPILSLLIIGCPTANRYKQMIN